MTVSPSNRSRLYRHILKCGYCMPTLVASDSAANQVFMSTAFRTTKLSSPSSQARSYPSENASLNTVSRYELAGNPVSHRRRRVDHADAFVPRLQTLRDVIHHDIILGIAAFAVEGANMVADLEPKLRDVRCSRAHDAPPRRTQ